MDGNAGPNGRAKRSKREPKKKKDAKGADLRDAPRKSQASTGASAISSAQLTMLKPVPLTDPRPIDVLPPKPRHMNYVFTKQSEVSGHSRDFYEVADKISNRNGFRYTYAITDPLFSRTLYRQTDVPPYHARFSFEDSPVAIAFSEDGLAVSTNEPWHSARANVCAREGTYYYEARVISGVVPGGPPAPSPRGHVRLGFARREADLDVNVGVDCYGYGIRDVNGEVVNRMRCEYFFPKDEAINEGDVIGMLITLPPISLHKKIVEGKYDPAVDGIPSASAGQTSRSEPPQPMNFIRDRIPFHLKSDFLFQQSNIFPSKHLRDYAFNLKETPTYGPPSPGNTEDPSLRTLPGSSITIYKNGVRMGTPFTNLYAFLPPASRAANGSNNLGIGERENADDGMIGYYPMVSCHNGGAVECRFEEPWWIGPPVDDFPDVKPFGERYNDQIVEDVVADIVDEIEAIFAGWGPLASQVSAANAEPTRTSRSTPSAVHVAAGPEIHTPAGIVPANVSDAPGGTSGTGSTAPTVIEDGTSLNASTPLYGSVAGEMAASEDHDMEL
ncbi:hypothetical protein VTO42DRAFT_6927 [Malbranchea cinnamomea]